MIRIKEAIIVEGVYDKNTLSNIVDTLIIDINGFGIYKNKYKLNLLRSIAEKQGIIIMTDSDGAGFQIRNFLKSSIDNKYIKNAYIPQLPGKERRKSKESKEGLLGVEGMDPDVIIDSLKKSGATLLGNEVVLKNYQIKTIDLYDFGLIGKNNSKLKREKLLSFLGFPNYLSNKALVESLNILYNRDEILELVKNIDNM